MTTERRPVALVAGASRGLGLLVARRLGERGFALVLCARDEVELARAARDLRDRGQEVRTEVCDVSDVAAVQAMVARTESESPIEVMICVAGIIQVGPLDALERQHFEQAIDVMLWGPVNTALAVLPGMRREGRGRIGVITSIGGLLAAPHLLPYSTAKFGAVGFAKGLRSELVGTGVTVTTVAPGLMRTGSHQRAQFVGDQGREYAWFATAASLPLLSMDADRAAARIVDSVLRGRPQLLLTPLAQVASRVAAVAPGLTAAILGLTVRLLPSAPTTPSGTVDGRSARSQLPSRGRALLDRLTVLGDRAAARFHQ
ncbi:MAG: SDR family NAD(P)-dependent oxidoreductase [Propionibacteriaceae bacterium]